MRPAKDTDFFIPLDGVGTFRFGRRTYGDRLAIRAEYLRLVKDIGDSDDDLSFFAGIVASHRILCVEAPNGWSDLAEVDLTAPDGPEQKIYELFDALKAKEDSFRRGEQEGSEAEGA